jgi:hypothetical protein
MTNSNSTTPMHVLLDGDGRIIAAVDAVSPSHDGPDCRFEPMAGQHVRTVSFPSHIASIRNGHDLHLALAAGRVDLVTGAFVMERRIELRDRPPREPGKKG